jgi:hypothetical protein
MRSDQQLWVDWVAGIPGNTTAPVSYWIEEEAELILPNIVYLRGTRNVFEGQLTGIIDLHSFAGSAAEFASSANTALLSTNATYTYVTRPGNFSFGSMTIRRNSLVSFRRVTNEMFLEVADLTVKYQGEMDLNHAEIFSSTGYVEAQGYMHLDGMGFGWTDAYQGPSPGVSVGEIGSGAAHGGEGQLFQILFASFPDCFASFLQVGVTLLCQRTAMCQHSLIQNQESHTVLCLDQYKWVLVEVTAL